MRKALLTIHVLITCMPDMSSSSSCSVFLREKKNFYRIVC